MSHELTQEDWGFYPWSLVDRVHGLSIHRR